MLTIEERIAQETKRLSQPTKAAIQLLDEGATSRLLPAIVKKPPKDLMIASCDSYKNDSSIFVS